MRLTGITKFQDELKIFVFFMDTFTTIFSHAFRLTSANTSLVAIVMMVFGSVCGVIIFSGKICYLCGKKSFEKKTKCCRNCSFELCVDVLSMILMLVCILMYFIGDNLQLIRINGCNRRIEIAASLLLIFALVGFRFTPKLNELSKKCFVKAKDENNEEKGLEHKFYYDKTVESLYLIPEIDGYFTSVSGIIKTTCDCNLTKEYAGRWAAFCILMAFVMVFLMIQGCSFYRNHPLPTKNCRNITCIMSTLFFVWIVMGLYLIADNKRPLDCVPGVKCIENIDESGCKNNSIVRLSFLSIALFIYLIIEFIAVIRWCTYAHKNNILKQKLSCYTCSNKDNMTIN